MRLQDTDATDILCAADVGRRDDAGKGDRCRIAIRQPPVAPIESRNRGAAKESQAVQVRERIRYFVVLAVHLAYPI